MRNRHSTGNAQLGRREFLAGSLALLGSSRVVGLDRDALASRFLACRRFGERQEAVLLDARGHDIAALALPARGHSFAIDAAGSRAVVFGRQPGFFARVLSLPDFVLRAELPVAPQRHFFGHGVFSGDGNLLYATENNYGAGRGVLGIYDARPGQGWQRLGEFDTGGIGPHEAVLLPDARTLCVANGGLLTHPDTGKTPLNLPTMRPSLAYLDAASGRLLENVVLAPELFQLSIRHLAVGAQGEVWFACQHEGPAMQQPPLLGCHRRGGQPVLHAGPRAVLGGLRNYLGSISIDAAHGTIATSSPVGGTVAFWGSDGKSLGAVERPDGCGIAPLGDGRFLVSDGFGAMMAAGPSGPASHLMERSADMSWDNHMRRV